VKQINMMESVGVEEAALYLFIYLPSIAVLGIKSRASCMLHACLCSWDDSHVPPYPAIV
jgi:hypothetical protein